MYKVIKRFYDLRNNHAFSVGDTFPHDGVDEERIAELSSGNNKIGVPLIEEVAEKPKRRKKKQEQ